MSQVPLTVSAIRQEPSSARLVFTLFMAGLIAGLTLAGVYEITKPMIERNQARALEVAVYKVVPGSSRLQRLDYRDGEFVVLAEGEKAVGPMIIAAYDEAGEFRGYAIPSEGPGFQDTIALIYGYDPVNRLVIGMEILESRETPGLGDKIFKDMDFVDNFSALAIDPQIVLVRDGRTEDNEVDSITGATISARAVVNIINAGNALWLERLPDPADLPPLAPVEGAVVDDDDNEAQAEEDA